MSGNEPEIQPHIKNYFDKKNKIYGMLDATKLVHNDAAVQGFKHLEKDDGSIDYSALKGDVAEQDKVIEKMMAVYESAALKQSGLEALPEDELKKDIVLMKYIGITKDELTRTMRKFEDKYTVNQHESIRDKLIEKQSGELIPLAGNHIQEDHYKSIVDHVGLQEDYFNFDAMTRGHATSLLSTYQAKGGTALDIGDLGNLVNNENGWNGDQTALTEKAKEELKKLRDNDGHLNPSG